MLSLMYTYSYRNRLLKKARKHHFRSADTNVLEVQFTNSSITITDEDIKLPAPCQYDVAERSDIIRLTYKPTLNATNRKKHN